MSATRYFASALCLAFATACGPAGPSPQSGPAAEQAGDAGKPSLREASTSTAANALAPGAAPQSCEQPAAPMATGVDVAGEISATRDPYPANARYHCFELPAGVSEARLLLSGLSADLDLYVGYGAIESVQGVDLNAGETYEWKSNAFGTGDEVVTLTDPRAGIYYVEIVSYEGQQSPYVFSVR